MDRKDDGRFVFGADDKNEPEALGEQSRSRLDNLNLKVTLIAVIMPCLIGIVMIFGYIDMNRRVATFKNTGSEEVRTASKEMERMVSSLQVKNARMEKLLTQEFGEIKTRLNTLEKKVGKAQKDINFIVATRLTKKQTEAHLGKFQSQQNKNNKALVLIQADTADAIDRTRALETKSTADAEALNRLKRDLATAKKEVSSLSRSMPSLSEIDKRMKKERILMQVRIDEVRATLGMRIDKIAEDRDSTTVPVPPPSLAPQPGAISEQNIGD
ncbi:hypothetical protein [Desulfoluna sp.]|uniref:coiled-coil domain-containing protein n=1 Tax=Desulfoluna sp. TaxID=2045199 RepID=UPI00260EC792|nr:hypothetical protein [Desulfoluna sp.]